MKFILNLILLTSLFFSAHLFAEEVTVGKVSKTGKKAVIYIPEGMTVEKGQTLVIGGGKTKAAALLPGGASARSKSIGASFDFLANSIETTTATGQTSPPVDENTISFDATFMKNSMSFEYGGGATYSSISNAQRKTTEYRLNGLFEYNFIANKPGATIVPYVGAQLSFLGGSEETSTSPNDASASGFGFGAYGGVKYFIAPASGFALTADALYLVDSITTDDDTESVRTRLGFRVGVRYYF